MYNMLIYLLAVVSLAVATLCVLLYAALHQNTSFRNRERLMTTAKAVGVLIVLGLIAGAFGIVTYEHARVVAASCAARGVYVTVDLAFWGLLSRE